MKKKYYIECPRHETWLEMVEKRVTSSTGIIIIHAAKCEECGSWYSDDLRIMGKAKVSKKEFVFYTDRKKSVSTTQEEQKIAISKSTDSINIQEAYKNLEAHYRNGERACAKSYVITKIKIAVNCANSKLYPDGLSSEEIFEKSYLGRGKIISINKFRELINKCKDHIASHPTQIVNYNKRPCKNEVVNAFSDKSVMIHVIYGRSNCCQENHKIVNIYAEVLPLRLSKPVKIIISKCETCTPPIYWIHNNELEIEEQKYGILLFRKLDHKQFDYDYYGEWWEQLSPESKLRQFGYCVGKSYPYSHDQRIKLLKWIIDQELMRKYEIINHLEFLIRIHLMDRRFSSAINEWESDLKEIRSYKVKNETVHGILYR